MKPILFSRDLLTGDETVDAQHRALFSTVNTLLFAGDVREDPELFRRGISFFHRYVGFHFEAEERAMERSSYPGLARHRDHHGELARRVAVLIRRAEAEGPSEELRDHLYLMANDWLRFHVRVLDRDFVQHLGTMQRTVAMPDGMDDGISNLDSVIAGNASDAEVESRIRSFW
jgi:hemerythrin